MARRQDSRMPTKCFLNAETVQMAKRCTLTGRILTRTVVKLGERIGGAEFN